MVEGGGCAGTALPCLPVMAQESGAHASTRSGALFMFSDGEDGFPLAPPVEVSVKGCDIGVLVSGLLHGLGLLAPVG